MQEKLNPAGAPAIEPKVNEPGKDLEFTATFEVYPEVEVQNLEKVKVEKPAVEVTEKDVDNMLETLQKQQKQYLQKKLEKQLEKQQLKLGRNGCKQVVQFQEEILQLQKGQKE